MRLEIIEVRSPAPSSAVPVLSAAVPVAGTRLAEAASGLKQPQLRNAVTLPSKQKARAERREFSRRGERAPIFSLATQDGGRVRAVVPLGTGTAVIV